MFSHIGAAKCGRKIWLQVLFVGDGIKALRLGLFVERFDDVQKLDGRFDGGFGLVCIESTGTVSLVLVSPGNGGLDKSICFALVDSRYSALGTPLYIRIRKRVFPGEVIKKRFYKTNYKK